MKWRRAHALDGIALMACAAIVAAGLITGSHRSVANYGHERDFYDTWAPRADAPFDASLYTHGTNEIGYPLLRNHPPGYSLIVAAGNTLTGSSFRTALILSALAAGAFGWINYLLLSALFDRERALAGMLLLLIAVYRYSFLASTDLFGGLTATIPLWVLLRKPKVGSKGLLLVGVLCGVAYLVRTQGIYLLVGVLATLPLLDTGATSGTSERPGWRVHLTSAALVLGAFLIVTGPWLYVNWRLNGSPMFSTTYLQVAATYWDPDHGATLSSYWRSSERFHSLSQVVLEDPAGFTRRYLKQVLLRMPRSLGVDVLRYPGFFLFGAGFVFLLAGLDRRRFAWLAVLSFGYLLLGLVYIVDRYFIFLFPALYFTVAYAALSPFVREQFTRVRVPATLAAWTVVFLTALLMLRDTRIRTEAYLEAEPKFLLELAETLRDRANPGDRVMVHEPHIPYLSGVEAAVVPGNDVEEIIAYSRRHNVRFLVYDRIEAREWPGRAELADPSTVPSELRVLFRHEPSGTVLYELESPSR